MKTIDTLIYDIREVVKGNGGWDKTITKFLADGISQVAEERFSKAQEPRDYLSLSALGTPCQRKLWYKVNMADKGTPLEAEALGTFFYGDLLEVLVLALVKAAGHEVTGMQDRVDVHGVKGHRDCIIDGVTVDVKSTSSFGFEKFKSGKLREDDPFGYISQLSSYVYAGRDDPLVKDKSTGAFLAISKERFKLCLDTYDFTEELKLKEKEIQEKKDLVAGPIPTQRLAPIPQTKPKAGEDTKKPRNMKLPTQCGYCEFLRVCRNDYRTFIYSTGPVHLTKVVSLPRVKEVKNG